MTRVLVALVLVFACASTRAVAAAPKNRFGVILPSLRHVKADDVPRRDRYAGAIAQSIASAASIDAVAIPPNPPSGLDLQALCKSLDLDGVIDPYVGWRANEDTVSATAQVFVLDCHGTAFFQGEGSDVAAVDSKAGIEPQVDARMAAATKRVAQRFAAFIKTNAASWDNLRLASPSLPRSKADTLMGHMAALGACSTYAVSKHFIQAIAACNDGDVRDLFVPYVTKMMQRAPQDDASRSAVATFGLMVVGAYLWQADAHYQLGEPSAGVAEAQSAAEWMDSLAAYFTRPDAAKYSKLRAADDELRALRLRLATEYPAVIAP